MVDDYSNFQLNHDSHRLFHGRGGFYPGWEEVVVDFYPPVLHVSLYIEPGPERLNFLMEKLKEELGDSMSCVVLQRRYKKANQWEVVEGDMPAQVYAYEGRLKFPLRFLENQNIGFFPDIGPGRNWIKKNSSGKSILNLFSYTCALSAIALEHGAASVHNVDMSRAVLNSGRENHRLNNLDMSKVTFRQIDIMKSLGSLEKKSPYDIIIIDPPSFQYGSFDASKDYLKIIRRLENMVSSGGQVMACLNSPFHKADFLIDLFSQEAKSFKLDEVLYREESYKEVEPDKGLKILILKRD